MKEQVVGAAHQGTGHVGWESMWRLLRTQCHFPGMGQHCLEFVQQCQACSAADPQSRLQASPTRPVSPSGPWDVVQIDTLELGASRSGTYHCVLVVVDVFTEWAEVVPLRCHDSQSLASAFVNIHTRSDLPRVVRSDNSTGLKNAPMSRSQGILKEFCGDLLSWRYGGL